MLFVFNSSNCLFQHNKKNCKRNRNLWGRNAILNKDTMSHPLWILMSSRHIWACPVKDVESIILLADMMQVLDVAFLQSCECVLCLPVSLSEKLACAFRKRWRHSEERIRRHSRRWDSWFWSQWLTYGIYHCLTKASWGCLCFGRWLE